jgi:DNA-binding CsgD family transcriptional regulator
LHPELTHREREIIKLLIDGFPNKKISDRLNISLATVQTHRRNIYKKLNLKGIGELIAFAYENNIQSAPSDV